MSTLVESSPPAALVDAMGWIRRGWTQGAYCRNKANTAVLTTSNDIARVDLAWALWRAARDRGVSEELLRRLVQEELPPAYQDCWGLERWNDKPGRTRTEIMLVLERTLSRL